jgi:predicted  nucleic acid-binding Zn-ribbon protein
MSTPSEAKVKEQMQIEHDNRFKLLTKINKISKKKADLEDDLEDLNTSITYLQSRVKVTDERILQLSRTLCTFVTPSHDESICQISDQFAKIDSGSTPESTFF